MRISRKQTCVYWAPTGLDAYGKRLFDDPVELDCRWEDTQKMFTNKEGEEVVSSSIVYPVSVVALDGYLWLGTLAELSSAEEADPQSVLGAKKIQSFNTSVSVNGRSKVYKAWL